MPISNPARPDDDCGTLGPALEKRYNGLDDGVKRGRAMIIEERLVPASAAASAYARAFLEVIVDTGDRRLVRETPARADTFVQVILEGGHGVRDLATGDLVESPDIVLVGPCEYRWMELEVRGRLRLWHIQLQPTAARALFGTPAAAVLNSYTALDAAPLLSLLADVRGRFDRDGLRDLTEAWLAGVARDLPAPDAIALAARRLRDSGGVERVAALARRADLSPRQFARRFADQVGLSPKAYARLCRISLAVDLHERQPELGWARIAAETGYADQAHLTREFRALAETTPARFRRYQFIPG